MTEPTRASGPVDDGADEVVTDHECDCGHVEQTPGYGHSIVRCVDCHRPGIRTFNPVHVTWEDELPPYWCPTHRTKDDCPPISIDVPGTTGFRLRRPSPTAQAMIERSNERVRREQGRL